MHPAHVRPAVLLAAALTSALLCGNAAAQIEGVPITGDRLGGFVLPVEPNNLPALFKAVRVNSWKVDSTQRLYLEGQVNVQLGPYDFYAEQAVVWLERIPSARGVITQVAVWFPQTSEPTKAAGLGASGNNLLITGSTLGEVTLRAVLVDPQEPAKNAVVARGQERLRDYLQQLAANPPALRQLPDVRRPAPPPPPPPLVPGGSVLATPERKAVAPPPSTAPGPDLIQPPTSLNGPERSPIIAPESQIAFVADRVQIDTKADTVSLTSGITIDVLPRSPGASARSMQMRAERAVIFLKPGTTGALKGGGGGAVEADAVQGVYLEGDVTATDFEYTVRAKRAYYDFRSDRATLVEGVLRTVDRNGIPLVARAEELRQFSQQQWQADHVRVSTSEFFTPHLSVGAERATITQTVDDEGHSQTFVQGKDATFRAEMTPFFWIPSFEGTGQDIPFRGFGLSYSGDSGARIITRWDLFGLLGMKPENKDDEATLYTDAWTNWGAGAGVKGNLFDIRYDAFGMWDFGNVERTSAGVNVQARDDFRGVVSADTTYEFTADTKLQVQLNYVSDEAFMQTFRTVEFANKLQKETGAYLASAGEHSELGLLLSYPTNDVITNSSQLASRPYQVAKYPEGSYKRWGDDLFGKLTWTQEYSANLMAIRFGKGNESTTGVRNNTFNLEDQIMPAGGSFDRGTTIKDLYQSNGYQDDTYVRLYTRQELSMPLGKNGVNVTPFASAAVSGYVDGNPGSYNPAADRLRGLLAVGVRASTDVMARYDSAESSLLDVHRIRHVITPYANAWYGYDTAPEDAYQIFDQDVEGATGGAVVQTGLRQRFQTMRGGPGNWQSVDWLVLDVGATWNDGADDFARTYTSNARYRQSPFPQYFTWRPELSQWGRVAYGNFKWAASSTLSFSGNLTYLLDSTLPPLGAGPFGLSQGARGSIGAALQHSPDVRSYIEYRAINNNSPESVYLSDQLLAAGIAYRVSRTYEIGFTPTYDLEEGDFRAFNLAITRETPDFTLIGQFGYDAIVGQYYGGLAIRIGGMDGAPVVRNLPFTQ